MQTHGPGRLGDQEGAERFRLVDAVGQKFVEASGSSPCPPPPAEGSTLGCPLKLQAVCLQETGAGAAVGSKRAGGPSSRRDYGIQPGCARGPPTARDRPISSGLAACQWAGFPRRRAAVRPSAAACPALYALPGKVRAGSGAPRPCSAERTRGFSSPASQAWCHSGRSGSPPPSLGQTAGGHRCAAGPHPSSHLPAPCPRPTQLKSSCGLWLGTGLSQRSPSAVRPPLAPPL